MMRFRSEGLKSLAETVDTVYCRKSHNMEEAYQNQETIRSLPKLQFFSIGTIFKFPLDI